MDGKWKEERVGSGTEINVARNGDGIFDTL